MFTLPDPLRDVVRTCRRRLGDPISSDSAGLAEALWTEDEIKGHFRDGIEELCRVTGILWDRETLDDIPPICNYNFPFEPQYALARRLTSGTFVVNMDFLPQIIGDWWECQFPWEAKYGSKSSHILGEIEFSFERIYAADGTLHQAATVTIPTGALQVERVTWNDRKIQPVRSTELEFYDVQYEDLAGDVQAYSQDKDGLDRLRKYKIPAATASVLPNIGVTGIPRGVTEIPPGAPINHMHMDEWGMVFGGVLDSPPSVYWDFFPIPFDTSRAHLASWLKSFSPWANSTVIGTSGGLRRLPGYHPGRSIYGGARHIAPTTRNTAVEYTRTPAPCEESFDRPQLPAFMLLYARHYTLWKCLARKGDGQNLKLAAHYKARWQQGLGLTQERLNRVQSQVPHGLGPQGLVRSNLPLARPNADLDYGQMNRY